MNAYELADKLSVLPVEEKYINWLGLSANILRKQAEKINNMEVWEKKYLDTIEKYKLRNQEQIKRIAKLEQALFSIANEHVELSHDKIKWQCEDHIRWAKEALK